MQAIALRCALSGGLLRLLPQDDGLLRRWRTKRTSRTSRSGTPFWQPGPVRPPDLSRVRRALEPSGWLSAARSFAQGLRSAGHEPGRLLVVGTAEDEPWHLTAHLSDAARLSSTPALEPVLVRHVVPPGARPHLAVDLGALAQAGRGATVLVAAPGPAGEGLLERLADSRRGGAALFALHGGDADLAALATEQLVDPPVPVGPDTVSHLVTELAGEGERRAARARWRLR